MEMTDKTTVLNGRINQSKSTFIPVAVLVRPSSSSRSALQSMDRREGHIISGLSNPSAITHPLIIDSILCPMLFHWFFQCLEAN